MGRPKQDVRNGEPIHYSVGVFIARGGNVLLIDRNTPPFGKAGLAGHLDEDEAPEAAVIREVWEESGLTLLNPRLIIEGFLPWDTCSRGIRGHHWYVFTGDVSGEAKISPREVKSIAWHPLSQLPDLTLEPAWKHWFTKLGYI